MSIKRKDIPIPVYSRSGTEELMLCHKALCSQRPMYQLATAKTSDVTDEIAIAHSTDNIVMALDDIQKSVKHDQSYIDLICASENGFPNTCSDLPESIRS